ncbi:MAG: hypothetical protein KZQ64_11270 [gamma proteobacterium symbiont of Bathyaustriella thionipta]|nr:hypothetical protein [gamma proteobacterium symbiont of Bathyaustriella thionipta]MCU7950606.1 hypothetical protein [gamma proteobacterium symbiont of Bathyaustriella thionipta]MCU7953952.1 hypothetical protein [gamma proteobacterium symbiont of Bathyaustriella thionipta]MCU7957114.1 hypothetical protein [gamma proteobacterium symbiont of Bathyaustriella thionipta]MCU7965942.1 hypothetical protein [gamma proteobacterium symbiont of Bathyaustriella thionipta]
MINELSQQFSIKDHLSFTEIHSGFPAIQVNNQWATATISLYGGQILEFQPHEHAEPVLWLSEKATYQQDRSIRGGIPICWPWFGNSPYEALPSHGFARISFWQVHSTESLYNGETQLVLSMPCEAICKEYQSLTEYSLCDLSLKITIGKVLIVELITTNRSKQILPISNALHTYFNVSDIRSIRISGLEEINYLDKLQNQGKIIINEKN